MGIGLPLVLMVLDTMVLGRPWNRRDCWRGLLTYAAPAAAAAWLAWHGQAATGAAASAEAFGWQQRLAQACYAHTFYLFKIVWPAGLAPMYERALRFDPFGPRFLASAASGAVVAGAAFGLRRRWPAAWAAWLSYIIFLAPVLGAVKYGTQLVADRYSYLPGMCWSLLAATTLLQLLRAMPDARRPITGAACSLLLVLGVASERPARLLEGLRDPLPPDTRPRSQPGRGPQQPGARARPPGRLPEAMEQYRQALQVRPRYAAAHNNLGAALLKLGRLEDAETEFRTAMADDPNDAECYNNLGLLLAHRKRYDEALSMFETALRLRPGFSRAALNRERVLSLERARAP